MKREEEEKVARELLPTAHNHTNKSETAREQTRTRGLPISLWLVKLRAISNKSDKVIGLRKAGKKEHSILSFKPLRLSKKQGCCDFSNSQIRKLEFCHSRNCCWLFKPKDTAQTFPKPLATP